MSRDSRAIVNAQAAGRCMGRVHSNLRWGQREAREAARVVESWPLTQEAWGSVLSTAQVCQDPYAQEVAVRGSGVQSRLLLCDESSRMACVFVCFLSV